MLGRSGIFLLLLTGSALAQFNPESMAMGGRVRVQVSFSNHSACAPTTQVMLEASSGFNAASSSVDERCVAEFYNVPAGHYRVRVSGPAVAKSEVSDVELSPGMTQEVEVRGRAAGDADQNQNLVAAAFVSVSDLGVPSSAAKEFNKASRLISKQEWGKSAEHLQKAIAIYPQYASAYNNLGAVYSHMGNLKQAREALQSAIRLNDHLVSAYLNLGRVSFNARDFPAVEASIGKALTLAAPDIGEFTLLAYAQIADRHLDQAIATSQQAHRSQLSHHAVLHLLAARAEDVEGKNDAMDTDLKEYLDEEPDGAHAEEVRKILASAQR